MPGVKGNRNNPYGRDKIKVRPLSVGLPEKEIILDQVIYWAGLQATAEEVASSFFITVETLDRHLIEHFGMGFVELKKRVGGSGKLSLRRYQFQQAEKNTSMAIWLGKQWLGQKDNEQTVIVTQEQLDASRAIMEQLTLAQQEAKNGSQKIQEDQSPQ